MFGCYIQFPAGSGWLAWKLKWMPVQRIRDLDGFLRLTRLKLMPRTPWGRLYLHKFHASEWGMPLHDHAYDFYTFPLRRAYVEFTTGHHNCELVHAVRVPPWRWSWRPAEHTHIVDGPLQTKNPALYGRFPFYTLFWECPQRRRWGFWLPCKPAADLWIYWKDYYDSATINQP